MSMVLFAIIGSTINAGPVYWVCYGIFCLAKVIVCVIDATKELS